MSAMIGLAASGLYQLFHPGQGKTGFGKGFAQLGQDLQAGNLQAAQADLSALQPAGGTGGGSLATAFQQLAKDLQSGNLPGAQTDYSTIQQGIQQRQKSGVGHHHHGLPAGVERDSSTSNSSSTAVQELFAELGQSLQSGNVSAAQRAYSSLQQDLQAFGLLSGGTRGSSTNASTRASSLNLTA